MKIKECFDGYIRMFLASFQYISEKVKRFFKEVLKNVGGVFQGNFREILRKFQDCFNSILRLVILVDVVAVSCC